MNSYYETPLVTRYAGREMAQLFSPKTRTLTWRKLWIALAKAEKSAGLPISGAQIEELERQAENIDEEAIRKYEEQFHHDVMAHIHAYGDLCPSARSILHLGATSASITDNADLLIMRDALQLICEKLKRVIGEIAAFADRYKSLPCVGFTHFQPAQPTTVGKRATLWLQDFAMDLEELNTFHLRFLGLRGATGTQASFFQLLDHDVERVEKLEEAFIKEAGLGKVFPVTGQTYPRKQDAILLGKLSGIGVSAHKYATDLRLLAHLGEVCESFGKEQVGSSAMPHKRNPIYAERICSLSRYLMTIAQNAEQTASLQWLERSLDDSANRRLTIPESFLCADAILELLLKLEPKVNEDTVATHLEKALPQLALESILMDAVKRGGDRQALHEKLRQYASQPNFLELVAQDTDFFYGGQSLNPKDFVGLAERQVIKCLTKQSIGLQ